MSVAATASCQPFPLERDSGPSAQPDVPTTALSLQSVQLLDLSGDVVVPFELGTSPWRAPEFLLLAAAGALSGSSTDSQAARARTRTSEISPIKARRAHHSGRGSLRGRIAGR